RRPALLPVRVICVQGSWARHARPTSGTTYRTRRVICARLLCFAEGPVRVQGATHRAVRRPRPRGRHKGSPHRRSEPLRRLLGSGSSLPALEGCPLHGFAPPAPDRTPTCRSTRRGHERIARGFPTGTGRRAPHGTGGHGEPA